MKLMKLRVGIYYLLSMVVFMSCQDSKENTSPPYSPQEALSTFRLPEGFKIELVASEPLIQDPTEIAFDEDGKMYVAQMEDYPADGDPTGRIMLLEDKDGDGFYESGTVFAENLPYVNGVMPWKGGVLVTTAPDILFMKDTTGNGVADVIEVMITGFALTNPQLRMSSLRYGLDNWIYGAYSRSGGGRWYEEFRDQKGSPLHFPAKPDQKLPEIFPGTDYRFSPNEHKIEPSGGMSQFGLSFDAAGNRFTVWNNVHIRHVVIDSRYKANNPYLGISNDMASIAKHGDAARVYSIAEDMLDLHESQIGHFTSACGNCLYTGNLFEGDYAKASYVCEPVSNLVHVDLLTPDGPTFEATRIEKEKEFLASTDSWFRPVNLTVGPDGGMYVVDYYRKLVEHPDWISMADEKGFYTNAGVLQEEDFFEGKNLGRIYRVVPKDFNTKKAKKPMLSKASVEELVDYLDSPNMWLRTNAQRLLVDRQDRNTAALLNQSLLKRFRPEGKIHSLWTLEGIGALTKKILLDALSDEDAVVRKQAILLGERRMDDEDIFGKLIQMTDDPDSFVQFQLALTLGNVAEEEVFDALSKIATNNIGDSWFQTAVLLGASENPLRWYTSFKTFEDTKEHNKNGKSEFLNKIASIVGARYKAEELSSLFVELTQMQDDKLIQESLDGLLTGMKRHSRTIRISHTGQKALFSLIKDGVPKTKELSIDIASRLELSNSPDVQWTRKKAMIDARDEDKTVEERMLAVKILGLDPKNVPFNTLGKILSSSQPTSLQLAVVEVLLKSQEAHATSILIENWNMFTLKVRDAVEEGLLLRTEHLKDFLAAVDGGKVEAKQVSRNTQNRLLQHGNVEIRNEAEKVFKEASGPDRNEVVAEYHEATTKQGNIEKGKAIFKASCSSCHVLEGVGHNYGPDLLSVSHQTKITLMTMILHPNHNIAPGYEGYLIETVDGRTLAGIMGNESTTEITLRGPDGNEQVILRDNISSISPMSESLMPEGLESSINIEQMADLLEYLKNVGE